MEDEGLASCANCGRLKEEIEMIRVTSTLNFTTLRNKLTISSALFRDIATKTKEYNAQTKKLEDATRLVEKLQRDCVKYESELSRVLQEVEPLREERKTLVASNKAISTQLATLEENLGAAKKMEEQYSLMVKDHHSNESKFQAKITTLKQQTTSLRKELSLLKRWKEDASAWKTEHQGINKTLIQTRKKFVNCVKHLKAFGSILECHKLLTKQKKFVLNRYVTQVSSISSDDSEEGSDGSDSECDTDGQLMERMFLESENADENMPTAKKMVDVAVSVDLVPISKLNSEMVIDLIDSCIYEGPVLSPLPSSPKRDKHRVSNENKDETIQEEKSMSDIVSIVPVSSMDTNENLVQSDMHFSNSSSSDLLIEDAAETNNAGTPTTCPLPVSSIDANENLVQSDMHVSNSSGSDLLIEDAVETNNAETPTTCPLPVSSMDANENLDQSDMHISNSSGSDLLIEDAVETNNAETPTTCPLPVSSMDANENMDQSDMHISNSSGSNLLIEDAAETNNAETPTTCPFPVSSMATNENLDQSDMHISNSSGSDLLIEDAVETNNAEAPITCSLSILNDSVANEHSYACKSLNEIQNTNDINNSERTNSPTRETAKHILPEEDLAVSTLENMDTLTAVQSRQEDVSVPNTETAKHLPEEDLAVSTLENMDTLTAVQSRQEDVSAPNTETPKHSLPEEDVALSTIEKMDSLIAAQSRHEDVPVPNADSCNNSSHIADEFSSSESVGVINPSNIGAAHSDFFTETAASSQENEQPEISDSCLSEKCDISVCDVELSCENGMLPVITNPKPSKPDKPLNDIQTTVDSCEVLGMQPITSCNKSITSATPESEQRLVQGTSSKSGIHSKLPGYLLKKRDRAKSDKIVQFFKLGKTAPRNWDGSLKLDLSKKRSVRVHFLKKGRFLKRVGNVVRSNDILAQRFEKRKENHVITEQQKPIVLNETAKDLNDVNNTSVTQNQTHCGHMSSIHPCSHTCTCSYNGNPMLALRPLFIQALLGENKCHQCCQTPLVEQNIQCTHKPKTTNIMKTVDSHLENIVSPLKSPANDCSESFKHSVESNLHPICGVVESTVAKVTRVARSRDNNNKNMTNNLNTPNINAGLQQVKSLTKSVVLPGQPSTRNMLTNLSISTNESDVSQQEPTVTSSLQNNVPQHNKFNSYEFALTKSKKSKKKSLRERLLVGIKHPCTRNLNLLNPAQLTAKTKLSKSASNVYSNVTKQELEMMLNEMILPEKYKSPLSPIPNKPVNIAKDLKSADSNKIRTYARRVITRKRDSAAIPLKSSEDGPPSKKLRTSDESNVDEMPSCERIESVSEDVHESTNIEIDLKEVNNLSNTTSPLLPSCSNLYFMECARPTARNSKIGSRIIDNIVQLLTPLPPLPPDGHSHLWNSVVNRLSTSLSAKEIPLLCKKLSSWMLTCTTDHLSAIVTSKYIKPKADSACEFNLSDTEKKCLYLVQKLQAKDKMEKIQDEMTIRSMKSILSSDATTLGRSSLCRFYISLCKLQNDIQKARVFCYDIIYNIRKMCGPLLVNAIGIWPEMVTCKSDGDNSLLMIFLFTLNKKNAVIGFKKEFSARSFLSSWYSLDLPTRDIKELTTLIVKQLKTGEQDASFEAMKALELLGRIEGWTWANNCLIREVLWPILQRWCCQQTSIDAENITDNAMANCLFLLGCLAKQCPAANKASAVEVLITMRALLEKSLTVPFAWCVQEAAVMVTLMLLPYDKEAAATASRNWIVKHKEQISGALKQSLMRAQLMPNCDSL